MTSKEYNLHASLVFQPEEGILRTGSDRLLIFRHDAWADFTYRLQEVAGPKAKILLFRLGYQIGRLNFKTLAKQYEWESPEELLMAGWLAEAWEGRVKAVIDQTALNTAKGQLTIVGRWYNSFEADQQLLRRGPSQEVVCHLLAGYGSGWCSAFMDKPMLLVELSCKAQGHHYCSWEVQPISAWEKSVAEPFLQVMDMPIPLPIQVGPSEDLQVKAQDSSNKSSNVQPEHPPVSLLHELLDIPFLSADIFGKITSANEKFWSFYGIEKPEDKQISITDCLASREEFAKLSAALRRYATVVDHPVKFKKADGHIVELKVRGHYTKTADSLPQSIELLFDMPAKAEKSVATSSSEQPKQEKASTENPAHEKELRKLSEIIKSHEKIQEEADARLKAAEEKLQESHKEKNELAQQLSKCQKEIEQFQLANPAHENELNLLKETIKLNESAQQRVGIKLAVAEEKLQHAHSEKKELAQQLAKCQKEVEKLEYKRASLAQEYNQQNEGFSRCLSELHKREKKIKAYQQQEIDGNQAPLKSEKADANRSFSSDADAPSTTENEGVQTQEIKQLEEKIATLEQKLNSKNQALIAVQAEVKRYRTESKANERSLSGPGDQAVNQVEASEKMPDTEAGTTNSAETADELAKYRTKMEIYKRKAEEAAEVLIETRRKLEVAEIEHLASQTSREEDQQQAIERSKQLERQLADLQLKLNELETELTDANNSKDVLLEDYRLLEKSKAEQVREYQVAKQENEGLLSEQTKLLLKFSDLQLTLVDHQQEIIELKDKLEAQVQNPIAPEVASEVNKKVAEEKDNVLVQTDVLGQVTKEVRVPLQQILGYTDELVRHLTDGELINRAQQTNQTARAIIHLLDNWQLNIKLEREELALQPASLSIFDLAEECEGLCMATRQDESLSFSKKIGANLPQSIKIDGLRLRQLLFNLLHNALSHTKSGKIALAIEGVGEPDSKANTDLIISITDTGSGWDTTEGISQTLTRPLSAKTLTIALQLAGLLGGKLTFSKDGEKANVAMLRLANVPIDDPTPIGQGPRAQIPMFLAPAAKVLITDDLTANRQLISAFLSPTKVVTLEASNGQEALLVAKTRLPSLILMDVQMPVLDGAEVLRLLHQRPETQHIPVIAMTASKLPQEHERLQSLGFQEVLIKPVQRRDLLAVIEPFLKNSQFTEATPSPKPTKAHKTLVHDSQQDIPQISDYFNGLHQQQLAVAQTLKPFLKDIMLIHQPKDKVGGDFCWADEKLGRLFLGVGDAPGHGQAGAWLADRVRYFVERVVSHHGVLMVERILDFVHAEWRQLQTLSGPDNPYPDLVNMAVLMIDKKRHEIHFASAKIPLVAIEETADGGIEVVEYKAERLSIGDPSKKEMQFQRQVIPFSSKQKAFYVFTDGFANQLGGQEGKKFGRRPLKTLLAQHYQKPFAEQKSILQKALAEWAETGGNSPTDDVLLLGFKVV